MSIFGFLFVFLLIIYDTIDMTMVKFPESLLRPAGLILIHHWKPVGLIFMEGLKNETYRKPNKGNIRGKRRL